MVILVIRHGELELDKLFVKENILMHPKFLNALMKIEEEIECASKIAKEKETKT